jgi:FkbM family methyltransferase
MLENLLIAYARWFPIRRGKLRIIELLWRTAMSNQDTRRLGSLQYGNLKMVCDLNEMLQRQFYFFGTYFMEEHILGCWQNAAKGAKVIIDGGANAGIYSLAALASQHDATVYAFEPTPEIAARLRDTAKLNGLDRLHVCEAALSSQGGYATLKRCRGELGTNEGMNYISLDMDGAGTERVQTVCLDRFCKDHMIDYVDLLKLDVQGHEYSALVGSRELIRAKRIGSIFMELNWDGDAGARCPASQAIGLLERGGYQFSKPGTPLAFQQAGDWLRALSDLVAQPVCT